MIAQNSSWTSTIPTSVPSGNYLIRFETIALHSMPAVSLVFTSRHYHSPNTVTFKQFYPEYVNLTKEIVELTKLKPFLVFRCAQIQITGGGSLAPTADELVTFPGAYTNNDPGSTYLTSQIPVAHLTSYSQSTLTSIAMLLKMKRPT